MPVTSAVRNRTGGAGEATLAGDVTNSSTSFTFGTGNLTGWPTANFDWRLGSEKIKNSSRSGDTITCTAGDRGADNTTAAAHLAGSKARHVEFASSLQQVNDFLNLGTAAGDISYWSASGVISRLAIGATNRVLGVVAGVPAWIASATSTLTTTGDLLYASAANTLQRLGIGSTGQVLTVAGGVPTWAAAVQEDFTIPAGAFAGTGPTLAETSAGSETAGWLLDQTAVERVAATFVMPTGWSTYAVDLWWMNTAATSGNVAWIVRSYPIASGGSATGNTDDAQTLAATASVATITKSTFHAVGVAATAGQLVDLLIIRNGAAGGDTLANDIAFIGAHVRKIS